jgi:hypothetical protein
VLGISSDDLPAQVWQSEAALREAIDKFKFWPSAAEIRELLLRHAARLQREVETLDAIAKGTRGPRGMAREAFGYLDEVIAAGAGVPPERRTHPSSPRLGMGHDFDEMMGRSTIPYVAPMRSVAEQLAALGPIHTNVDLLAARRAAIEGKSAAKYGAEPGAEDNRNVALAVKRTIVPAPAVSSPAMALARPANASRTWPPPTHAALTRRLRHRTH